MQIGIGRQRKTVKEKKREIISGGIKITQTFYMKTCNKIDTNIYT